MGCRIEDGGANNKMEEQIGKVRVVYIIVNAGHADEVTEIIRSAGAGGATIMNARGEGALHEVFMGITVDAEKEIILCVAPDKIADRVMSAVKEQAGIKTPAHGVCFSMPVDRVVGMNLIPAKPTEKEEHNA